MRFSHELFHALLLVSNDPIGVAVTSARSKRSKISVAALNFGAEFAANAFSEPYWADSINPVART
jgi:hypothetical protein